MRTCLIATLALVLALTGVGADGLLRGTAAANGQSVTAEKGLVAW